MSLYELPPERDPRSWPRDRTRSLVRDWTIFIATIACISGFFALIYGLFAVPWRALGDGYLIGGVVGSVFTALVMRLAYGHWPRS